MRRYAYMKDKYPAGTMSSLSHRPTFSSSSSSSSSFYVPLFTFYSRVTVRASLLHNSARRSSRSTLHADSITLAGIIAVDQQEREHHRRTITHRHLFRYSCADKDNGRHAVPLHSIPPHTRLSVVVVQCYDETPCLSSVDIRSSNRLRVTFGDGGAR